MKTAVVLFSLAVIAVSNAAVLNGPGRFALEVGSIGPEDTKLTTINNIHTPIEGVILNWMEAGFSMPTVQLTIAHIQIVDHFNSGAKAEIVNGGVGSDHLLVRFTPFNNRAFNFETVVHGKYTLNQRSGALPEMVTFERKDTSPSQ